MKKIYVLLTIFLSASFAFAQQENTLHVMRSLPQASYTNPAKAPKQPFYIGLPGLSSMYMSFANSGFNYNTLFTKDPETDSLLVDLPKLHSKLNKKNYLTTIAQTDLLSFGVKINARMYFTYNLTAKAYSRLMYPKDMLGFIVDGNASYLGKKMELAPAYEGFAYLENALGASYVVDKKLTVGAKLKFLNGGFNVRTEESNFTLYTAEDNYHLTLEGDVRVLTNNLQQFDSVGMGGEYSEIKKYTKNGGFAVDLGATYAVNNKLSVGLSILDLGSIKWKSNPYEYSVEKGKVEFGGLDAKDLANGGGGFESFKDSLESAFDFKERAIDAYRTGLPTRIYLTADYQLHRSVNASAIFFSEVYKGRLMPGFSTAINKDFGRRIGAAVSYTMINDSYNNLGAGFSFRLTPFQFYMVSDNVISAGLMPKSAKAFNLRAGLNLVFGTTKTQSKLPYQN